jgi:hypothetical protein
MSAVIWFRVREEDIGKVLCGSLVPPIILRLERLVHVEGSLNAKIQFVSKGLLY